MIPNTDHTLLSQPPVAPQLDDGFSPPILAAEPKAADLEPVQVPEAAEPWLWEKSDF